MAEVDTERSRSAETPGQEPARANGQGPAAARPPARRKRKWVIIIGVIVAIIVVAVGLPWYLNSLHYESTDDAFIDANITRVSPRVSGHVTEVLVDDNQVVKKGDVLVRLDPNDLQTAVTKLAADVAAARAKAEQDKANLELVQKTSSAGVQQAEAARLSAQAQAAASKTAVTAAEADLAQARAQVDAAQAEATRSAADFKRYEQLLSTGDVTPQQVDSARAAATTAAALVTVAQKKVVASQAALASAQAQVEQATADVSQAQAGVAAANVVDERVAAAQAAYQNDANKVSSLEAQLEQSKLNFGYGTIVAPVDGRVTGKSVAVGNYVSPGQALLMLVQPDVWVTANFKETQLAEMKIGQPATIKLDAYPGHELKGHVDSFQQGSGAAFSLLPPENATGNFVKVVQRVPVKIVFDQQPGAKYMLGPGMSVVPTVKVK